MSDTPTIAERLIAAEKAEAEVEKKREEDSQERRLLVLDLKAKFRAELGPEDSEFSVLEFSALNKVVVVKRPDLAVAKAFDRLTAKREATHDELVQYATPNVVFPPSAEFRALVDRHPKVALEAAAELRVLEGVRVKDRTGK